MFARALRLSAPRIARGARTFSSGGEGRGGGGAATLLAAVAVGGAAYVYYDASQAKEAMEAKINALTVDLHGKTNAGELNSF